MSRSTFANGHQPSAAVTRLLPELAHHIRRHLNSHQLACATRVCRAWYEIWMPYLWENVHYDVPNRAFPSLGKHASWTRHFEGRYLTGGYPTKEELHRQSRVAVNRREKGGCGVVGGTGGVVATAGIGGGVGRIYDDASNTSPLSSSPLPPLPPLLLQLDILRLEGSHLQELSLFKTDITLERLDRLLESLSQLQVFRFEVMNRVAPDYVPRSIETRPVGTWQGKSLGLLHNCEEQLLGVVATRLRRLRSLELTFDARADLHVGRAIFLLDALRHSLKALRLENFALTGSYASSRNNWNTMGFQAYANRLLGDASYMGASMIAATSSMPSTSPPLSGSVSHSSSSSSLSAVTMTNTTTSSDGRSSSSLSPLEQAVASLTKSVEQFTVTETTPSLAPPTGVISLTLIRQHWNGSRSAQCIEEVLRECPNLEELNFHDTPVPNNSTMDAILEHNPKLTRLSFSKVPNISSQSLEQLFRGRKLVEEEEHNHGEMSSLSSAANHTPQKDAVMVPQLESLRLGYLHQSLTAPLRALAEEHGGRLRRLSIQWCPSVTTQDLWPIIKKCSQLEELALQLTKVSTKIFEDIPQDVIVPEPGGPSVLEPKMHTWACASTLRRFDIGGPMFVDYSRYRERFLRPTVYHHLSPNPYLIGTTSSSSSGGNSGGQGSPQAHQSSSSSGDENAASTPPGSAPSSASPSTASPATTTTASPPRTQAGSTVVTGTGAPVVGGHTFNSSIVRIAAIFNNFVPPPNNHPYVERHWTDESLNPLYTLQARIQGFPKLRELGLQTKGIEQWILKGFNHEGSGGCDATSTTTTTTTTSNESGRRDRIGAQTTAASTTAKNGNQVIYTIKIQTLTLMNQQGRILDRSRVLELIAGYPYLRRLICDRATIFHHRLTPAEKEDLEQTFARCNIEVVQI
ncbi:hypothetical protein BGW42_007456 [Actinomortierella wolfii]|nr:hypothetical protein BGW42_007456 [Actinomortierella wolfii]